jgi:MFS transporter, DHA1 family, multidrug resistance protein
VTLESNLPSNTGPQTAARARLLVVLGMLSAFAPVTTHVYLPSLPQAAAALNTSPAGIQSSLTACLLGLAAGQLVAGPLSDSQGRRKLLLAAMAMFVLTSALCASAPNIVTLDLFRLLQGGAGGAGIAICFAIVRDLYAGRAAARAYSILMAVSGIAPIVSPTIGGQILRITDWRGVFLALTGLGLAFLGCAYTWVGETLPVARRTGGGFSIAAAALRRLAADPGFTGYALAGGFSFAAMFAYISASPFVFEGLCHMSPQLFTVVLAFNATGILLANTVNARLLRRFSPRVLLDLGLAGVAVGAAGVLVVVITTQHHLYVYALVVPLFLMVASFGLTRPNAAALALDRHPDTAGSAAAFLGVIQYALGAIVAPVTGLDRHSAIPLGATVVAAAVLAVLARIMARRESRQRHDLPPSRTEAHNSPMADPAGRAGELRPDSP